MKRIKRASAGGRSGRPAKPAPLPQRLAALSKEQLVKLVATMLERCPELSWLLDTLPGAAVADDGDALFNKFYGMALNIVPDEMVLGRTSEVVNELDGMLEIAAKLEASGNPAGSVALFRAVLQAALEYYDDFHDEGGISEVIDQCAEGLVVKLGTFPPDAPSRGPLLLALFRALEFDVRVGGIGVADSVPQAILDAATEPERKEFAARVRHLLDNLDEPYSEYRRHRIGGLLLELEGPDLDDETYLRLCRETNRHGNLVDRLLQLGRRGEATAEAEDIQSDYDLLALADTFARHGRTETFAKLLEARMDTTEDARVWEWLGKHYRAAGRLPQAIDMTRRMLRKKPCLAYFSAVRDAATDAECWDGVRAELLDELAEEGKTSTLIDIHLDEGDIMTAIPLLEQVRAQGRYMWQNKRVQVARAAEADYPLEAVALYRREASALIRQRGRKTYAAAARHLITVRRLLRENGQAKTWQQCFAAFQAEVKSLPACKDEMRKAGLTQ